ncbi:hypothetical protein D3C71_18500 [compost metagenome]
MFSLILAIIGVALVAALAIATLYYGGTSWKKAAAQAHAAKIHNQGQQLLAAAELYQADHGAWPNDIQDLVDGHYLQQLPQVAASTGGQAMAAAKSIATLFLAAGTFSSTAFAAPEPSLDAATWRMPMRGAPVFLSMVEGVDACKQVNLMGSLGRDGILSTAYSSLVSQCYGSSSTSLQALFKRSTLLTSLQDVPGLGDRVTAGAPPTSSTSSEWLVVPERSANGQLPTNPGGGSGDGGEEGGTAPGPVDEDGGPDAGPVGQAAYALRSSQGTVLQSFSFGRVPMGTSSPELAVVLKSTGPEPLVFSTPAVSVDAPFEVVSSSCGGTLPVGQSCTSSVVYKPVFRGSVNGANLRFHSNAWASPAVTVSGTSYDATPRATLSPESQTFPSHPVGTPTAETLTATLSNPGDVDISVGAASLEAPFAVSATTCEATLVPQASCTFTVTFAPEAAGPYSATLSVPTSAGLLSASFAGAASSPVGEVQYLAAGTYSWVVPEGVTAVSALTIGGGGGGGSGAPHVAYDYGGGGGGGGGGLAYSNIIVTPGETLTITVGVGGAGGALGKPARAPAGGATNVARGATSLLSAAGGAGGYGGGGCSTCGGAGGAGGTGTYRGGGGGRGGIYGEGGGGGGAAGYLGNGGAGGQYSGTAAQPGSAGGGGGGGGGATSGNWGSLAGKGGGVGVMGAGATGTAGGYGVAGGHGSGGVYGAGGAGGADRMAGGAGTNGAVRIIWGEGRSYPSAAQ